jgi:hypothetical protein
MLTSGIYCHVNPSGSDGKLSRYSLNGSGVNVIVGVGVFVGVAVDVGVEVDVDVAVGVKVAVGVGVSVGIQGSCNSPEHADINKTKIISEIACSNFAIEFSS